MKTTKLHKKGELLVLSEGEYSDYGTIIISKVLKDFTEDEVANLYPHSKDYDKFDGDEFVQVLIRNGYVKELDYEEWNLGSYGPLEFSYIENEK